MNLFQKMFSKAKINCPRCLGKGEVDWDDIKRLNNELKWLPGKCAYCDGVGKVKEVVLSKVSVDNVYLNIEISQEERQKLREGNQAALDRAGDYNREVDGFIAQVKYLYFTGNLSIDQIVGFYLIPKKESEISLPEKDSLYEYVTRIINTGLDS